MRKFEQIKLLAEKRKGGAEQLSKLLPPPVPLAKLAAVTDDRYLAQMSRCVFNAGFHWRVITNKWPGFEQAFHGFDLGQLLTRSPEEWENYLQDTRIVRNWQKIQTVYQNALMIDAISAQHGSFGAFFSNWPVDDQVGLMADLKKKGSRLGGQTCQYFIRFIGKDGFVTSGDVVAALIANGIDISDKPTSMRDQNKIQAAFNEWHQQSGLPITHISRILSFTVGDNVPVEVLTSYHGSQSVLDGV
ncbi:MAG: DNA-3-methyladenine glycosylase I [Gammaproteobacteria bacterium]|nr:DNA-3-methyladenine glycosylase I [Gammaproteobacteria bacterium]